MKKNRSLKQRLVSAVLVLVMAITSLIGTTFAWFTDIASSKNNVVQSGNLNAEMYWSDTLLSADSDQWKNANNVPVFTYDNWEPGYTDVKYIKISNEGNLSFKWRLTIEAAGGMTKLAEAIEVYYVNPVTSALTSVEGKTSAGLLSDVVTKKTSTSGALLPKNVNEEGYTSGYTVLAIALHMDETVGNKYKNISIGDGFELKLLATQFSYENDSFGNGYDEQAKWPNNTELGENSATAPVTPTADGKVPEGGVSLVSSDSKVAANVPAGVSLLTGASKLTLSVTDVEKSQANITLEETEASLSVDVHVSGIAEDNDVAIAVSIKELLPVGLNMGNYRFYHVENGVTVEMTLLTDGATPAHNNYEYDPATGDVVLYLKSFSEVALVADTENAWNGTFANDFAGGEGTESDPYLIANADQLAYMSKIVSTDEAYAEAHYKLIADVNFGGDEVAKNDDKEKVFYPIGYWAMQEGTNSQGESYYAHGNSFSGTFDGNGNTISNIYQNTWLMDGNYDAGYWSAAMGLFGAVFDATIKNLTVDRFQSDGEFTPTGCVAAYAGGNSTFENISLTNCNPRVYNTGNGGIVGLNYNSTQGTADKLVFKNITVDQTNKISALWGSYDVACGGILGRLRENAKHDGTNTDTQKNTAYFENCHIAAIMDVNNDACANYQYYQYRYSGMLIGTVDYIGDVPAVGVTDVVTAKNCTVTYGEWNEYWYCELVKNSLASYTHDHQFSRLTKIEALSEIQDANGGWIKEGNFVIPADDNSSAVCYHIFKNAEGNLYQHFHDVADESNNNNAFETVGGVEMLKEDRTTYYIPFGQLFTGYGWGSSPVYEYDGVDRGGNGTVKSEPKFNAKNNNGTYKIGTTITLLDIVDLIVDETKLSKSTLNVFASPHSDNGTVNANINIDTSNWKNSTITFNDGTVGVVKLVITDYFYCTPTVIYLNAEEASEKFTANTVNAQNAYTQITLDTLFGVKDGATIGNVTATVTDPNGTETTITGTASDWASKTIDLTKDGTWTVVIKDDDTYCAVTTVTFTVNKVDKFTSKFDKDFLYRVGNQNNVALGTMFSEIETDIALSSVNVTVTNVAGDAAGTFTSNATWTSGTIQFSGTGVVKVTISADGANEITIPLEVINAKNITSAEGTTSGGNFVLVRDINTSTYVNYLNSTLYGNGFTYSLNGAPTSYNSKQGHGVLITKNTTLDNLVIVGDIYNEYGAYTTNEYYNSAVDVLGDTIIQNCYISGCAAPVIARSSVTIKNTTLYGGAVANLMIKSGTVTVEDVTTVNYNDGRSVIGMGIVVHSDASENTKLVLNGNLTQYNFLNEEDTPTDSYAKNLHNTMFGDSLSQYHFGTTPNRRVNTGIISLAANFNVDDITDNANTGYSGSSVALSGVDGYVYTQLNTSGSVNNDYDVDSDSHVSTTQGAVPPAYSFDYTNKNYVGKTEGSNDYCYEENGTVNISMDEGDAFVWDTSILTVSKYGSALNYTAKMDDVDYTGKSITFSESGYYYVIYSYTDPNNYSLDANGNIITYEKTYEKTVKIYVAIIKSTTKHAEFTFGSNQAVEQITVDNKTYLSATNKTADGTSWGCMTVGTSKIYYPIVEAEIVQTKKSSIISTNAEVQAYFYVFDGTITIVDYENGGSGNSVTYNSSTTTMPSGLTVVKGNYGAVSGNTTWYSNYNDSTLSLTGAENVFKYAGSNAVSSTPTTRSNKLCYASDSGLSTKNRSEYYTLVQYSYADYAGTTYYYYVGYHMQDSKNVAPDYSSSSGCFAEGSMVTLADGTQKPIEQITYGDELLAWDFNTGAYAVTVPSLIESHEASEYRVINLKFADGTVARVIVDHGFFDVETNNFVYINEENVSSYIGHSFVKLGDNGTYESVELIDYEITVETISYYNIQTAFYNNCIIENMFTLPSAPEMLDTDEWFDYFEIGEDMKYDEEKMQEDIDKYGLYTYEDFAEYVTYEQFLAFNGPYLKVLVERGVVTYDELIVLIGIYVNP